jgi:hypothetical protein
MRYGEDLSDKKGLKKPWEKAAALIKCKSEIEIPEQRLWLAVMVQAIRDIGSEHHTKHFWKKDNLKLYCDILAIDVDYVINVLKMAGLKPAL